MLVAPHDACRQAQAGFAGAHRVIEVVGQTHIESCALPLYFRVRPDVTVLDRRVARSVPMRSSRAKCGCRRS